MSQKQLIAFYLGLVSWSKLFGLYVYSQQCADAMNTITVKEQISFVINQIPDSNVTVTISIRLSLH